MHPKTIGVQSKRSYPQQRRNDGGTLQKQVGFFSLKIELYLNDTDELGASSDVPRSRNFV